MTRFFFIEQAIGKDFFPFAFLAVGSNMHIEVCFDFYRKVRVPPTGYFWK